MKLQEAQDEKKDVIALCQAHSVRHLLAIHLTYRLSGDEPTQC